jgi:hypothetical protein
MKKTFGAILIGLGLLLTAASSLNARNAPNPSYLIGTFLPGLLFLIFGLALRRDKTPQAPAHSAGDAQEPADIGKEVQSGQFKTRASVGVGVGIVTMFMGSGVAQQGPDFLLLGVAVSLGGWALLIWGCVNYMRWKGYSGWFGLFGYLLLPGLIILVCFPNRRKRMLQKLSSEHIAETGVHSEEDRRSGYRFLLTLAPLGVFFIVLSGLLFSSRSNIDAAEWMEVAPPGIGFQALMPGTPRLEQKTQESPAGNVELNKFTVEPKGKKELFMIVSIRFPEGLARELGGKAKLLELGRTDLLSASQGQLKSERQLSLSGCPGLELEVLPPKGAIIRARIYATKNQVYQVFVHVPEVRLASEDVQKFFDSFKVSAEPGAAPDRGGS